MQARCNEFGHPEPTQHTRDEASLSRTGVDAHGRICAWVCLLPQVVDEWVLLTPPLLKRERGSFVAAGDRLPVHLNSSYSTACPGNDKHISFPVEAPEQVGRDTTSKKKKKAEKLELEAWPDFRIVQDVANEFQEWSVLVC